MASDSQTAPTPHRLRRWLLVVVLLLAGTWLTFFDSHSLLKRIRWHQELARLTRENHQLEQRILELEDRLQEAASEPVIEQVAREQYGMRRRGETVYRVERAPDGKESVRRARPAEDG